MPRISFWFWYWIMLLISSTSPLNNGVDGDGVTSSFNQNKSDCNSDEYRCLTSLECIPKWWHCDHILDCQDGSDEWQQSDFNVFDYVLDSVVVDGNTVDVDVVNVVQQHSFEIPLINPQATNVVGSGTEVNDSSSSSTTNITVPSSLTNLVQWCQPCDTNEMFLCKQTKECIPRGWMCDGQLDCGIGDQSDETNDYCQSISESILTIVNSDPHPSDDGDVNLAADHRNHHHQPPPYLLLYNSTKILKLINLFNSNDEYLVEQDYHRFRQQQPFSPISSEYLAKQFCWLDHHSIDCWCLEQNQRTSIQLPYNLNWKHLDRIELDWTTKHWYLLDRIDELLFRCDYQLKQCQVIIDHQILSRSLDFQLDPDQKLIFISRQGDRSRGTSQSLSPAILRANSLDGSQTKTLIQIGIIEPKHLCLDRIQKRLFWIDTKLDLLEHVDYNGGDRKKLKINPKTFPPIIGLKYWSKIMKMYAIDDNLYLLQSSTIIINNESTKSRIKLQDGSTMVNKMNKTNKTNKTKMMINNSHNGTSIATTTTTTTTTPTSTLSTTTTITLSLIQVNQNRMMLRTYRSMDMINVTMIAVITNNHTNRDASETITTTKTTVGAFDDDITSLPSSISSSIDRPILIYSRLDPGLIKFRPLHLVSIDDDQQSNVVVGDDDRDRNGKFPKALKQLKTILIPITFSRSPTTFDIDPFRRKIYYLDDYDTNLLYHDLMLTLSNDHGSIEKQRKLIKRIDLKFYGYIDRIESISYDWCNHNVYLVERNAISVLNINVDDPNDDDDELNDEHRKQNRLRIIWRKEIIKNLLEPSSLALDPERGLMFFSATIMEPSSSSSSLDNHDADVDRITTSTTVNADNRLAYRILKSNMDGTELTTVIELDKFYVNTLTVDPEKQYLYWCDTLEKTINRINYDGSNSQILSKSSRINLANSLIYFNDSIYWTEIQHGTIQRFDLKTNQTEFIWRERSPLFQIKIFQSTNISSSSSLKLCSNRKPDKGHRTDLKCSQLKLRTSGGNSVCHCDDHFQMDSNNQCQPLKMNELSEKFCQPKEIYLPNGRRCVRNKIWKNFNKRTKELLLEKNNVSSAQIWIPKYIPLPLPTWSIKDVLEESNRKRKKCSNKEFRCDRGHRCIPYHWLCDGQNDCKDETDESETICEPIPLMDHFHCPSGYFQCRLRFLCIPKQWRCDQQSDCGHDDPSDEQQCPN